MLDEHYPDYERTFYSAADALRDEGMKKERCSIIKKFLQASFSIEEIMKVTGLPKEEIAALA